jgi:hypothetical protein
MVRFWNADSLRRVAQIVLLVAAGSLLSGCIIVPARGPHFYHPYYYR